MAETLQTGLQRMAAMQNLAKKGGAMVYTLIGLAKLQLSNREWIESPIGGGGDEFTARDRIRDQCFGPFCVCSVVVLIEMYNFFTLREWQQAKFSILKLWQMYAKATKKVRTTRKEKLTPRSVLYNEIARLNGKMSSLFNTIEELKNERDTLKRELETLKRESKRRMPFAHAG